MHGFQTLKKLSELTMSTFGNNVKMIRKIYFRILMIREFKVNYRNTK